MHGEEKPTQPRVAQVELAQEAPDQERVGDVKGDIREVVAKRVRAPEVPLKTFNGECDRIIICLLYTSRCV